MGHGDVLLHRANAVQDALSATIQATMSRVNHNGHIFQRSALAARRRLWIKEDGGVAIPVVAYVVTNCFNAVPLIKFQRGVAVLLADGHRGKKVAVDVVQLDARCVVKADGHLLARVISLKGRGRISGQDQIFPVIPCRVAGIGDGVRPFGLVFQNINVGFADPAAHAQLKITVGAVDHRIHRPRAEQRDMIGAVLPVLIQDSRILVDPHNHIGVLAGHIQISLRCSRGGCPVKGQFVLNLTQILHLAVGDIGKGDLGGIVSLHTGCGNCFLFQDVGFPANGGGYLSIGRSCTPNLIGVPCFSNIVRARPHPPQVCNSCDSAARSGGFGSCNGEGNGVLSIFKHKFILPHLQRSIDAKAAVDAAVRHLFPVAGQRIIRIGGTRDIIIAFRRGNIFRGIGQLQRVVGVQDKACVQNRLAILIILCADLHRHRHRAGHQDQRHSQRP